MTALQASGTGLLPYLALAIRRRPSRALGLWALPLFIVRYAFNGDRGQLKGALIAAVLGGSSRQEIESLTAAFVQDSRCRRLRAGALEAITRHRTAGDRLVGDNLDKLHDGDTVKILE